MSRFRSPNGWRKLAPHELRHCYNDWCMEDDGVFRRITKSLHELPCCDEIIIRRTTAIGGNPNKPSKPVSASQTHSPAKNSVAGRIRRKKPITETQKDVAMDILNPPPINARDRNIAFHRAFCEKMIEVAITKNADYTGGGEDPFSNFTGVEQDGICSTEQGFLVRMRDKFARIQTFVKKGILQVKDETVSDSLHDLANYCALFAGYLNEKRFQVRRNDSEKGWLEAERLHLDPKSMLLKRKCPCGIEYGPGQEAYQQHLKQHHESQST